MDGAAERVDLRGLRLLERCRTLRRDDASREVSRCMREIDAAEAAEQAADARLRQHRMTWHAREEAILAAASGSTVAGQRFRSVRHDLDRLADEAIRLQAALKDAAASVQAARTAADAARTRLNDRQRRLQQSEAVRDRVTASRAARAEAVEEQELDDDLALRYVAPRR